MSHHPIRLEDAFLTRRDFLCRCGMGMGAVALTNLLSEAGFISTAQGAEAVNPLAARAPQFHAKAKRVVHFFLNGGPSHVDTFDPKPALARYEGKPVPNALTTERKTGAAFPSPFAFKKYGQSGIEVSDLFAETARHVDDMAVIRS